MSTTQNQLNVKTAADITAAQLDLDADVVIIGSGAGGGINAYELAKAGKKVIVLEAGPYVPSEKFTEMMAVSMATLYEGEGAQSNTDGDITVLQGRCVGGSTVVNAALCFRTPDYYLNKWGKEYGLTNLTPEVMVTYLPWACNHGAVIYADTRVTKINTVNGAASGVNAEVVDPKTGKVKTRMKVNAPIVVLAAGPTGSPLLLQQSGLANSSGQVGKNFACHPSLSVTAMFDKQLNDFHGATHSLFDDSHTLPDAGGWIQLNAVQDPVEASFMAEPGTGKPYVRYMQNYPNSTRLITLIHDKNVGEVTLENGYKEIRYQVDDEDFEAMKKGLKDNARILFAAGAKYLYLPTSDKQRINSVDDIDSVIDALENEPARYRYTSFHPQGTCRMGADKTKTVVNPYGETHDIKKLYVVDASLLPTSIGYNPSETVYALASYIADHINQTNPS